MELRPYQQACHDAVWRSWGDVLTDLPARYAGLMADIGQDPFGPEVFEERICVDLPTSAGKTILSAKIIRTALDRGERCLFVGDTDELIHQPVEKFRRAAGIIAAVEKASQRASLEADVVIGSMKSLTAKRLERFPRDHFRRILIDEFHRSTAQKFRICEYFHKAAVCGLTGTAFRQGKDDLSEWLPQTAFRLSTFNLIAQGYAPKLKVLRLPVKVEANQLELGASPEGRDVTAQSAARAIVPYFREIARILRDHPRLKDRTILVFLPLIETSEEFARICREEGITAQHCDGSTADRAGILQAFEAGRFRVLSNPQTFSTGVDFIRCDCVLNLRLTRSRGLYRQMVGRALRVLPGIIDGLETAAARRRAIGASAKPDCLVLDILCQAELLGICGPASLADDTDDDEVRGFIAQATDEPRDLEEIRKKVLERRERELVQALRAREKRKAFLLDAQEIVATTSIDPKTYFPESAAAARRPTAAQIKALENRGIDGDTIKFQGLADKILAELGKRNAKGLTPVYTFSALRRMGYDAPEFITLDMAVKILGADNFPFGFGKWAGRPFSQVPGGFWWWVFENRHLEWMSAFPAEIRYAVHLTQNRGRTKSLAS